MLLERSLNDGVVFFWVEFWVCTTSILFFGGSYFLGMNN